MAAAALLYAALAIAFVSPALVPGKALSNSDSFWYQPPWVDVRPDGYDKPANPEIDDIPSQMHPFLQYTRERLPDIPLWNPHIAGGRPFLANAQSAIFSPFSLPTYVLPFYRSLALVAALKLFLAAFGTFLLARRLRMGNFGGLLAGVVYGFSLWLVTWLAYPHASVWALIPWLLFLTDRLVERPSGRRVSALGALTAAQFACGHPESSFHAMVATGSFFALRWGQVARSRGMRPAGAFAAALALGALAAAAVLLPFLELVLRSADIEARAGTGDDESRAPQFLLAFLLPEYWGRPTQTPLEPFMIARAYYVGALALVLAFAALVIRPTVTRIAAAAFGLAAGCVVFGVFPIFDVVTALPGFSSGHNSRLILLAILPLALLAGWGLSDLLAASARRRAWFVLWGGLALLLAPLVWVIAADRTAPDAIGGALRMVLLFEDAPANPLDRQTHDVVRGAAVVGWLLFCGAALALVWARLRGRLGAAGFAAAAVALAVVDLFRVGMGYHPAIDRERATQPATGAVRYLERRAQDEAPPGSAGSRFVSVGSGVGAVPQNVIPMRHGLYEARGYDLPIERRYDRMWRRYLSPELADLAGFLGAIPLSVPKLTDERLRVLSLLGVRDVLTVADQPVRIAGLRQVYAGPDARVYENRRALPRAWVVGEQLVVSDEDAALDALGDPSWDPRRTAIFDEGAELRVGRGGDARLVSYEPERVVVEARSRGASTLVLSDLHYPGWKAEVDGEEVEIERVNYVMRGVPLADGRHRVEFRYEPVSWRIGWILSLAGLGLLAALALLGEKGWRFADRVAAAERDG